MVSGSPGAFVHHNEWNESASFTLGHIIQPLMRPFPTRIETCSQKQPMDYIN